MNDICGIEIDFSHPYDCAILRVANNDKVRNNVSTIWLEPIGRKPYRGNQSQFIGDNYMINNTNHARWDRLNAKSLDNMFINEMLIGLNSSPFEAKAILEKVHDVFGPLFDSSEGTKPGQIQVMVVDASVPPNIALANAKQKLVTLTLHAGKEDLETRRIGGIPALRQKCLCRICEEAFQQGGLLTLEDIANLFNCSVRTMVSDLNIIRQQNINLPLRSTVKDMGRAITHRRLIIKLWMEGHEYTDIALKACHSIASVHNYVNKFKRCIALVSAGFDINTIAFLVKISPALTKEFQHIGNDCEPVPHRKNELDDFIKKNTSNQPEGRICL